MHQRTVLLKQQKEETSFCCVASDSLIAEQYGKEAVRHCQNVSICIKLELFSIYFLVFNSADTLYLHLVLSAQHNVKFNW